MMASEMGISTCCSGVKGKHLRNTCITELHNWPNLISATFEGFRMHHNPTEIQGEGHFPLPLEGERKRHNGQFDFAYF